MNKFVGLRAVGVTILAVTVLQLAGCGLIQSPPMGLGKLAFMRDGQSLLVAVCQDMTITEIQGNQREGTGSSSEWVAFWDGTGSLPVIRGDVLATSTVRDVFGDVTAQQPALDKGVSMEIGIRGDGASGMVSFGGEVRLKDTPLSETQWLHANLTLTDDPCPKDAGPTNSP